MSGLDGNPCVPEQSLSTSNRYEKASHREWADTSGRMKTPVKGATIKGNALGNQLRREDILPPFSRFYSLGGRAGRARVGGYSRTRRTLGWLYHHTSAGNCPGRLSVQTARGQRQSLDGASVSL